MGFCWSWNSHHHSLSTRSTWQTDPINSERFTLKPASSIAKTDLVKTLKRSDRIQTNQELSVAPQRFLIPNSIALNKVMLHSYL
jgi:hypothetical protein